MPARQDLNKKHHGRRKQGSRRRHRAWAIRNKKKVQKITSKRRGRKVIRKYRQF